MYTMKEKPEIVENKIQNSGNNLGENIVNLDFGVSQQVETALSLEEYRANQEKRYEEYAQDLGIELTEVQREALKHTHPVKMNPPKSAENSEEFYAAIFL